MQNLANLVAKALAESLSGAMGADALDETLSSVFVHQGGDAVESPIVDAAETFEEAGLTYGTGVVLLIADDKGIVRELRLTVEESR